MRPANPSEIEFADEGAKRSYRELLNSPHGSKEEHAYAHAYVDWLTIRQTGKHAVDCTPATCPYTKENRDAGA